MALVLIWSPLSLISTRSLLETAGVSPSSSPFLKTPASPSGSHLHFPSLRAVIPLGDGDGHILEWALSPSLHHSSHPHSCSLGSHSPVKPWHDETCVWGSAFWEVQATPPPVRPYYYHFIQSTPLPMISFFHLRLSSWGHFSWFLCFDWTSWF